MDKSSSWYAWHVFMPASASAALVDELRRAGVVGTRCKSDVAESRCRARKLRSVLVMEEGAPLDRRSIVGELGRLGHGEPVGWDCFISYERRQQPLAEQVNAVLAGQGLRTFFDLRRLQHEQPLDDQLERAVSTCRAGLVVAQEGWGVSGWATAEYEVLRARSRDEAIPLALVVPAGKEPTRVPDWLPVFSIPKDASESHFRPVVELVKRDWAISAKPLDGQASLSWSGEADPGPWIEAMETASSLGQDVRAAAIAREALEHLGELEIGTRIDLVLAASGPLLRVSADGEVWSLLRKTHDDAGKHGAPRAALAYNLFLIASRRAEEEARVWLETAADLAREEGADDLVLSINAARGVEALEAGHLDLAIELFEELLSAWSAGRSPSESLGLLVNLASAFRRAGKIEETRWLLEEVRFRSRALRDVIVEAAVLFELGALAVDEGEMESAKRWLTSSLQVARKSGDSIGTVRALAQLAVVCQMAGDGEAAGTYLSKAVELDPQGPHVAWAQERIRLESLPGEERGDC